MTDEQKDIAQHMREWYEVFRRHGKGNERSVKAFLEAADLIEKLSTQLVNQATEYSQALKITTEQRDAAIADIPRACGYCKHFIVTHNGCTPDYDCAKNGCMNISGINTGWEWRGPKEENE